MLQGFLMKAKAGLFWNSSVFWEGFLSFLSPRLLSSKEEQLPEDACSLLLTITFTWRILQFLHATKSTSGCLYLLE